MKKIIFILLICLLLTNATFAASGYTYSNKLYLNNLLNEQQYNTAYKYYKSHFSTDKILALQNKLNELGYDCGVADGIMTNKTIDAVFNFQKDRKLNTDGIAGPITSKSLEASSSTPIVSTPNISGNVKVKFIKSYLEYNNDVGNQWSELVKVNSTILSLGEELEVSMTGSDSLKLSAFVTEFDIKPDNGTDSISLTLADLKNGVNPITVSVIVVEDRVKNSNRKAQWNFEFEIYK
jgi:peptidoglycan hydrolase-like protein with peptidoglycan-binding domain